MTSQNILIGSPLELTQKGILAMHKLKHEETYCYLQHYRYVSGEQGVSCVTEPLVEATEEEFSKAGTASYTVTTTLTTRKLSAEELEAEHIPYPDCLFWGDWLYPNDNKRTDKDLLFLFNDDHNQEHFIYERQPRLLSIPQDIEWYIDEDDFGNEFIREKARTWG